MDFNPLDYVTPDVSPVPAARATGTVDRSEPAAAQPAPQNPPAPAAAALSAVAGGGSPMTAVDFARMYLLQQDDMPAQGHYLNATACKVAGATKDDPVSRCARCDAEALVNATEPASEPDESGPDDAETAPTHVDSAELAGEELDGEVLDPEPDAVTEAASAAPAGAGDDALYARRRRNFLIGAAAVVAASVWFFTSGPGALRHSPSYDAAKAKDGKSLTQDATLSIDKLVDGDQTKAVKYLDSHGSLDGFTIKATGVRVASSGTSTVISRKSGTDCYMYAVLDGKPTQAQVDSTGSACTDAEIARAQKALDEQTVASEQASAQAAQDAFTSAADTIVFYAARNFDSSGNPSLTGLPAKVTPDVLVVSNHGTYVTAQATISGTCKEAAIGADGTVGDITSCK